MRPLPDCAPRMTQKKALRHSLKNAIRFGRKNNPILPNQCKQQHQAHENHGENFQKQEPFWVHHWSSASGRNRDSTPRTVRMKRGFLGSSGPVPGIGHAIFSTPRTRHFRRHDVLDDGMKPSVFCHFQALRPGMGTFNTISHSPQLFQNIYKTLKGHS